MKLILWALLISHCNLMAWDFDYSYNNLADPLSAQYLDFTSDISKTTIGYYQFYRPRFNGDQGEVTYKFEFDYEIESARLVAQIDTFKNSPSDPSGTGSLWAASEELSWVKLMDAPLNYFGNKTFKFDGLLPESLLNTKTVYIQARIEAATFQANSRFSYGHINSTDPIFVFQANFSEVPEPSCTFILIASGFILSSLRMRSIVSSR